MIGFSSLQFFMLYFSSRSDSMTTRTKAVYVAYIYVYIYIYILICYSMEQNPSWEADSSSARHDIPPHVMDP
jgi:hypothetical protein